MKISDIRKSLIKQTIIALAIVSVFVGIALYLDSIDGDYDRNIGGLKSQSDVLVQQVASLSAEYGAVVKNMENYNEIKQKQDKKMLTISKVALRDAIAGGREKYHIDNLDVKMEEVKALSGDKYKRSTAFIESGNVTISLDGLTDLDIFGLIRSLENAFIGIKFISLKISLGTTVDNTALISIKDTGFTPIVNSKATFSLFGLRNVNTDDNELTGGLGSGKEQPAQAGEAAGKKLIRLRAR